MKGCPQTNVLAIDIHDDISNANSASALCRSRLCLPKLVRDGTEAHYPQGQVLANGEPNLVLGDCDLVPRGHENAQPPPVRIIFLIRNLQSQNPIVLVFSRVANPTCLVWGV